MRLSIAAAALAALLVSAAASAEDPAWTGKVRKLLAAKQSYPSSAQDHNEEGTATIKINVAADGKVQSVELLHPSGSRSLDREAVTLPSKVGAFPAPGADSSVTVPLTWKLS
jgi:protein TonB